MYRRTDKTCDKKFLGHVFGVRARVPPALDAKTLFSGLLPVGHKTGLYASQSLRWTPEPEIFLSHVGAPLQVTATSQEDGFESGSRRVRVLGDSLSQNSYSADDHTSSMYVREIRALARSMGRIRCTCSRRNHCQRALSVGLVSTIGR
jgi:hypothetical protein